MTKYEQEQRAKKLAEAYKARRERFGEAADELDELHAWYVEYRKRKPKKKQ